MHIFFVFFFKSFLQLLLDILYFFKHVLYVRRVAPFRDRTRNIFAFLIFDR